MSCTLHSDKRENMFFLYDLGKPFNTVLSTNNISILESVFINHTATVFCSWTVSSSCCMHSTVNSFSLPMQSAPENSLHYHHGISLMSEKKNAREIILHPVRSSRLLISRYCSEKCFDMLKQLKGGRRRRGGDGGRRKSRKQRSKQSTFYSTI